MVKKPEQLKVPLSKAESFGASMAKKIKGGEVFGLIGELGSGKTTLTKSLGKGLGIRQTITSPTFVMMQQFETPGQLFFYHLDLYRTKDFREVKSLGITEWWGHPKTVTVIEWADKILDQLPEQTILIHLYRDSAQNNL